MLGTIEAAPSEAAPMGRAKTDPRASHVRQFRIVIWMFLACVLSYLFITRFVLMGVEIQGASMSPTLRDGERYLLYRCTYFVRAPHRGEIVVIKDPEDHGLSIKRIVAGPEEVIEFRTDGFYINGVKTPEPYLISKYILRPNYLPTRPVKLADNQYFVLGDNRDRSADSRSYGPVTRHDILGVISR